VGAVCGRGRGTKINITDTHNNNTCDKYKSSLRHIHDPVLLSLKIEGVRLLFFVSSTCFGRCFYPSSRALDCIYSIW
jgi:hypothetical protein